MLLNLQNQELEDIKNACYSQQLGVSSPGEVPEM